MHAIAILIPLLALGAAPPANTPAPTAPLQARVVSPTPADCRTLQVARGDSQGQYRRLGDLPPADAYQAVFRTDDKGCIDPLLVSERIGWSNRQLKK